MAHGCMPARYIRHVTVAEEEGGGGIVVRRKRVFERVTTDEASTVVCGVVDAWRMWAGRDDGLLKTGHDGWYTWGRRVGCGDGGSREVVAKEPHGRRSNHYRQVLCG